MAWTLARWAEHVVKYWKIYSSLAVATLIFIAASASVVAYGALPLFYISAILLGLFVYRYYTAPLLRRRLRVYRTALLVFGDYKLLRRRTKRLYPDNDTCQECLDMWERVHQRNARRAYDSFVELEGLWIKAGQYLSARADVLPEVFIETLSKCQDELPFKNIQETKATIESELGKPLPLVFDRFDITPIACASIAQVHSAVLNGERVVVKVQHKGIEEVIKQDLDNMERIISWIAWAEPDFDFNPIMREWSREVPYELDFVHEAENMKRVERESQECVRAKRQSPLYFDAVFPQVYDELTTKKVLVMSYIDGFKVTDIKKLDEHRVNRAELIQNIARAFGNQIFRYGFFNGDPHPGNILVQVKNGKAVPALLDFGLTKEIDSDTQRAFSQMAVCAADNDLAGLLNSIDDLGVRFNVNSEFLARETLNMTKFFFRDSGPKKAMKEKTRKEMGEQTKRMEIKMQDDESLRRNPIDAFPESLVFFQRTIFLIRGIATSLDVPMKYLDLLEPFARARLSGTMAVDKPLPFPVSSSPGSVAERLAATVQSLTKSKQLHGCQLVVYQKGEVIADIAAGRRDKRTPEAITRGTLFNVFSATKAITAAALHKCVEKGLLRYDDYISKHWRGFTTRCTVEQVLRHTAGLQNAGKKALQANFFYACDWDRMLGIMESAEPEGTPGAKVDYHYMSFGYIIGGLVEKVSKMPLRDFVRKEISDPLGISSELQMGLLDSHYPDVAHLVLDMEAEKNQMKQKLGKAILTGQLSKNVQDIHEIANQQENESLLFSNPTMFNHRLVRSSLIPAANGHFSARALAKFYATLANGGVVPGTNTRIFTPETVRVMTAAKKTSGTDPTFGLGFQLYPVDESDDNPAFGHSGIGGNIGACDLDSQTAFALTLNQLTFSNTATFQLLQVLFDSLRLPPPKLLKQNNQIPRGMSSLLAMA